MHKSRVALHESDNHAYFEPNQDAQKEIHVTQTSSKWGNQTPTIAMASHNHTHYVLILILEISQTLITSLAFAFAFALCLLHP